MGAKSPLMAGSAPAAFRVHINSGRGRGSIAEWLQRRAGQWRISHVTALSGITIPAKKGSSCRAMAIPPREKGRARLGT
jgi:hypothetical protein